MYTGVERNAGGAYAGGRADRVGAVEGFSQSQGPASRPSCAFEGAFARKNQVGDLAKLLHELIALVFEEIATASGEFELALASQQLGPGCRHLFHDASVTSQYGGRRGEPDRPEVRLE